MNTNNNNEKTDWAKRDVGALWKREGQSQKYLSGYVKVDELGIERELKIVVFSNKNKNNNDKAPDYRIYLSKPLEKTPEKTVQANKPSTAQTDKTYKSKSKSPVQADSEEVEEIL